MAKSVVNDYNHQLAAVLMATSACYNRRKINYIQIMLQKIKDTKAYQGLDFVQNKIYGRRKILLEIELQYIIARTKGREVWQKEFSPNTIYKRIILELLDVENNK